MNSHDPLKASLDYVTIYTKCDRGSMLGCFLRIHKIKTTPCFLHFSVQTTISHHHSIRILPNMLASQCQPHSLALESSFCVVLPGVKNITLQASFYSSFLLKRHGTQHFFVCGVVNREWRLGPFLHMEATSTIELHPQP